MTLGLRPTPALEPGPETRSALSQRLQLRSGLSMSFEEGAQGTHTLLHLDSRVVRLRGRGAIPLLRLLDGTRSLSDIYSSVRPEQRSTARTLIESLSRHGLLDPATQVEERWEPLVRLVESLGADGVASLPALRKAQIHVAGDGPLAKRLASSLEGYGLAAGEAISQATPAISAASADDAAAPGPLTLVTYREDRPEALKKLNAEALQRQSPTLFLSVSGWRALVGPFVIPGESACFECTQRRTAANDPIAERKPLSPTETFPGAVQLASQLAVTEALRYFATGVEPTLIDHLVDFDIATHQVQRHRILKVPRCPACGHAGNHPAIRPWMERWHD
ncbi:MAG: TOMM precursor leader peptide-binding protein [Acidobacteriota bacterium]